MNFQRLIVTLIFLSGYYAQAQHPKAMYIGHSLSDQIPDMVESLSIDHENTQFDWIYQSIPGAPLRWQWERKDAEDYYPIDPHYYGFYDPIHGLPAGDFDILVLTEAVPRYPAIIDETYAYADSFYRYATEYNPSLRVYLYEDWHCLLSGTPTECDYDVDSNPWRQRLEDDLPMWESVVDTLNARFQPVVPVCLIPAGQALAMLYDSIEAGVVPEISQISDLFSDDIHLTDVGKYFIACVHFATIHGTSPVGLTNQLQVWWGGDFDPPTLDQAAKFQQIAWLASTTYAQSCIQTTTMSTDLLIDSGHITLCPNPTEDIFEIQGLLGSYQIEILDGQGHIHHTYHNQGTRIQIFLDNLPAGLYFVRLQNLSNQQISFRKIIKSQ